MTARKRPEDLLKNGRKTTYTEEIGDAICALMASGQSLNSICKMPGMPTITAVYGWFEMFPPFEKKYCRAVLCRADTLADQITEIADETPTYIDENGHERIDMAAIQRNKLRVDARKWVACKMKPRVYGERQLQEVTGPEGGPVKVDLKVVFKAGEKK